MKKKETRGGTRQGSGAKPILKIIAKKICKIEKCVISLQHNNKNKTYNDESK